MRILLVNHYAGSLELGMEYRPYHMATEWVKSGHEVWIIAADQSHLRQKPVIPGFQDIDGIRYRWLKTHPYKGNGVHRVFNMLSFCLGLLRIAGWIRQEVKPDMVIASSTYPMDIWPCQFIARGSKARLIWELHDLWPLSPMELGKMPWWHPFILLVSAAERSACRNADEIVSMLPAADKHLITRGMLPQKFHYIPNGINPHDWDNTDNALPAEHAALFKKLREKNRWIVGYAGSHGLSNTLHTVIDAFALLKDTNASLVLVGQGPEKERLIKYAAKTGGDIHFLPAVPKTTVPALLKECDALYLGWQKSMLYKFGVSPNKIMDYAMAAKPIIHAIDAYNDMVKQAQCGISIPPENPAAIADAVRKLMNMPKFELETMGLRGKQYILKNNVFSALAAQFIDVMAKNGSAK